MSKIGIIGGSGLYNIKGLENAEFRNVDTPFGAPSDKYILGSLEGKDVVFLSRHSQGHKIPPGKINYRANIYGMKKLGVTRIISVSACGSLKEEIAPMHFILPDQFVDRTNSERTVTFFDDGIVAHIGFAEPVCPRLADVIYNSGKSLKITMHCGGTYLNMEGPAFSTRAESHLYRSWGMSVIGMTNMPEAKLAREAEICYTTLAAVTDYDCWHPDHNSVTVEMIISNLMKNVDNARKIIRKAILDIPECPDCRCRQALRHSIVTRPEAITPEVKQRLDLIIGKYIEK
ncbi:MAG: S-methyl-5'-thioadenosine phosphorylase [Candidatus Omnitrophota bacterium]